MGEQFSLDNIVDLERRTLCAICCGADRSWEAHHTAMRGLNNYAWRVAEHRIVYGALARVLPSSGESIAEQLPAQATRMGFPDVDWKQYLQPREMPEPEIPDLIRDLNAAAKQSETRE